AVEKFIYILFNCVATANTAVAAVPTKEPNKNCPKLQFALSIIEFKNIKNEYANISLSNEKSKPLNFNLTSKFFTQIIVFNNKHIILAIVITTTIATALYPN